MRVLVTGDRNCTDAKLIRAWLQPLPEGTEVIHGGARGVDSIAALVAKDLGLVVTPVLADWATYGKAAGPIRNQKMVDMKPDIVVAFHHDLSKSRGTADCVHRAEKAGIQVEVIG